MRRMYYGQKCLRRLDEKYFSASVVRVIEGSEGFTIRYDDDNRTEDFYAFNPDEISLIANDYEDEPYWSHESSKADTGEPGHIGNSSSSAVSLAARSVSPDGTTSASNNSDESVARTESFVQFSQAEGSCAVCSTETTFRCSRCGLAFYCSRRCQRRNWLFHRKACRPRSIASELVSENCSMKHFENQPSSSSQESKGCENNYKFSSIAVSHQSHDIFEDQAPLLQGDLLISACKSHSKHILDETSSTDPLLTASALEDINEEAPALERTDSGDSTRAVLSDQQWEDSYGNNERWQQMDRFGDSLHWINRISGHASPENCSVNVDDDATMRMMSWSANRESGELTPSRAKPRSPSTPLPRPPSPHDRDENHIPPLMKDASIGDAYTEKQPWNNQSNILPYHSLAPELKATTEKVQQIREILGVSFSHAYVRKALDIYFGDVSAALDFLLNNPVDTSASEATLEESQTFAGGVEAALSNTVEEHLSHSNSTLKWTQSKSTAPLDDVD